MRCAGRLVMSAPLNSTAPPVSCASPLMTFSSVVLPAPLGPISPCDLARRQLEADLVQRRQSAEMLC